MIFQFKWLISELWGSHGCLEMFSPNHTYQPSHHTGKTGHCQSEPITSSLQIPSGSPSVHLQYKLLGKCPQILFPREHVCCCACLWWHAGHLPFFLMLWKCQVCLSLETLHLLFSSSGMILHQFSAWIGHRSTGHSSSVTSLWRLFDTLSMGSPPIHRCVTSQHVVFYCLLAAITQPGLTR